jgi:peptidoglycan/xylan/chitin deacetylase (PgdA/CDA1 family)
MQWRKQLRLPSLESLPRFGGGLGVGFLLFVVVSCNEREKGFTYSHGAIVRGDTTNKEIALVFTGDEFGDGAEFLSEFLEREDIKASFFLTGNFYRNMEFKPVITKLLKNGNYLGSHSDRHFLYCDWNKRDSLLVSREEFMGDLEKSYSEMEKYGIKRNDTGYFLPPYEWYNDSIAAWTGKAGLQLINFTGGTRSNADYTIPEMGNQYVDNRTIYTSILSYEEKSHSGLNGFILLIHIGTHPGRTDKFYYYLPELMRELKEKGYMFVRIDEMLD